MVNSGPCINRVFFDIHQIHRSLTYGKWRHDKIFEFAAAINDSNLQRFSECTIPISFPL